MAEVSADEPESPSASEGREQAPSPPVRRWPLLLGWLAVALLVGLPTVGRVWWELSSERTAAAVTEDVRARITHLGRAARWKLPLTSGDEAALDELESIGREHASRAEDDVEARLVALAALREARASILARRGPVQWLSERARLRSLDTELAALMALEEQRWYGPTDAKDAAWHLARLEVASTRERPRAFVAALAFVASVVAAVVFLLRAGARDGARPWVRAWPWLIVAMLATGVWLVTLGRDPPADGPREPTDLRAGAWSRP